MDHYITPAELILLLSISWGPVFAIAALAQWRYILRPTAAPVAIWLSAALFLEIVLASAIWIAPLHSLFLSLDKFPDGLEIVSLPFQAGVLAAFIVTGCVWAAGQRYRVRPKEKPLFGSTRIEATPPAVAEKVGSTPVRGSPVSKRQQGGTQ